MISDSDTDLEQFASLVHCKIERIVRHQEWRGTNTALFQTPEGYYLCEVWFEQGKPQFQIRSNAIEVGEMTNTLGAASVVASAIQMAIAWAVEEMQKMASGGGHLTSGRLER